VAILTLMFGRCLHVLVLIPALAISTHPGRASERSASGWEQKQTSAPASPEAGFDDLAARATAAREAERLNEALTLYRDALALRPEWNEGRWYLATLLYELDHFAGAKAAFADVLQREPAHAGALGLKGLCEFELRQYEAALADLLQARSMGVAQTTGIATVVNYHAAILLTRLGEFEVANQMLADFVADATDTAQVIEAFGLNVLRMPVLPSELTASARELVQLAGRAGYAMAGRHVDVARAALDELVTRYPKTPQVHYARAVFSLTENPEGALDEFRRELEISPTHVPARLQMAFEYLKRGQADQALPVAVEAARLAPDYFAARLALGQVLLELNEVPRATAELEAATTLAPGSPQAYFMLARAYARAGRQEDAARARAEFTRLDEIVRTTRQGSQAVGGIPTAGPAGDRPR
jgi:tetratricopeptide (TPR) repeat protein